MTRQLTREQLQNCAAQHHSWHDAAAKAPQIEKLFKIGSPPFVTLDKKLVLGDEAFRMLCALNDFDRLKVADDLLDIANNPNRLDADTGRQNWFQRLQRSRYPFKKYHYKVMYAIRPGKPVLIVDIFLDVDLLMAPLLPDSMQRNALYRISKAGTASFTPDFKHLGTSSKPVVKTLEDAWNDVAHVPTHRVDTLHAAVNGMQNNLNKAAWLMGTHLENAYAGGTSPLDNYTLFHNPTDGWKQDLLECAYDKRNGHASHNSRHLAAVLKEAQERGHRTRWVAHSQGAIIFSTAVEFALKHYNMSLGCHSISLHAAGCNIKRAELTCERAGIRIERVLNNPFDLVANVAGANDLSCSGLARSLKFRGLVLGDDPLASPHTLPYQGLDTYVEQLRFTGHHDLANYALRFHPSETT